MTTFTNQATLSYQGTTTNSNITVGELQPALLMTKTAAVNDYREGSVLTYLISIINRGATDANGLKVIDDLGGFYEFLTKRYPLAYVRGSFRYYVNGELQEETTATDDSENCPMIVDKQPLVICGIEVPAGGNVLLVYSAEVTGYAPLEAGESITNTVSLYRGERTPYLTAQETVYAQEDVALTISKSLDTETVMESGQMTYTLLIQNTGNKATCSEDHVVVTDRLNPVLDDLVVTMDGRVLKEGEEYTYVKGFLTVLPGVVAVPAATFKRNGTNGTWEVTPGTVTLTITGTV